VARGFQVTFFRVRNEAADPNPSAFAPKQLLFAHAAVSEPMLGRTLHAERSARVGFGIAEAAVGAMQVRLDDWSLTSDDKELHTTVRGADFELALTLRPTQRPLLEGDQGYSRKDPDPTYASYYYSLPQLEVSGTIQTRGTSHRVSGRAWLDHEWSNHYVGDRASGWDWLGINLANGEALMIFRMRDADGTARWAGATWRSGESTQTFGPGAIEWRALRRWRSPRTGVEYPIAWQVRVGDRWLTVRPLMEDQENDARGSTGTLYWEGAVEIADSSGKILGRGYLELTGYGGRLEL
jgi:predicted secreted hydrolase